MEEHGLRTGEEEERIDLLFTVPDRLYTRGGISIPVANSVVGFTIS